jgi:hypothetical protein
MGELLAETLALSCIYVLMLFRRTVLLELPRVRLSSSQHRAVEP